MNPKNYIGRTLEDLAACTGVNHYGWRVFLLRDDKDDIGKQVGADYNLRLILYRNKKLRRCVVKIAYDYYGEYILRVIDPKATEQQ